MAALSYIDNVAKLRAYGFQSVAGDEALLTEIALRASRLFDSLVGVEPGHFAEASPSATSKVVIGQGIDRLVIPPHVLGSITTITLPTGYTAVGSEFIDAGDYLIRTVNGAVSPLNGTMNWWHYGLGYSSFNAYLDLYNHYPSHMGLTGWPYGVPVTITARWGYEDIPDDVVEAVLELSIAIWRSRDAAFLKVANIDGQVISEALPARTRLIADKYKEKRPIAIA